jgi:hypothetical protein
MKGLDFEAAMSTVNDHESSPQPTANQSVDNSKTKTNDKDTTHASSSSRVLKRKSITTTTNQSSAEPPSNINKKKKKKGNK